jgi:hypothetical protein
MTKPGDVQMGRSLELSQVLLASESGTVTQALVRQWARGRMIDVPW